MPREVTIPANLLSKCEGFILHAFPDYSARVETFANALEEKDYEKVIDLLKAGLAPTTETGLPRAARGTLTERAAANEVIKRLEVGLERS